jgi:quinol monooxygenase YgiN
VFSKDDSNLLIFLVVGRPFANMLGMILFIIRMKVLSEKRKELSQTISSLIGSIRTEKGCQRCNFFQSMEDENELCLLEEWDPQENLNSYLKSERFRVLRGAMNLLQEPYEMIFHTVFHPAGMKDTLSDGESRIVQ